MSCGSGCNCGSDCKCGANCGCGKMYPGLSEEKSTTTRTVILGLAPDHAPAKGEFEEGASSGSENGGCKCGDSCNCDPCTCK